MWRISHFTKRSHLLASSVKLMFCSLRHFHKLGVMYNYGEIVFKELMYLIRDSSVGIATRYGLDGPGIETRRE